MLFSKNFKNLLTLTLLLWTLVIIPSILASPQWSNNSTFPPSNCQYLINQNYQLNITWTNVNDTVQIEHNLTGSSTPQNESYIGNNSNEYYFDVSDLAAGNYFWRSFANDTNGIENVTDQWIYTINKSVSNISLFINKKEGSIRIANNTGVNITVVNNISLTNVWIDTNRTEWSSSSGTTPYKNTSEIMYSTFGDVINVTGWWDGNENYTDYFQTYYITINNPPTQNQPTITPNNPNTSSNLTCNYNNIQDADDDSVVNITNWYKNNESQTVLYMPFEGGSNSTYTKDYSGYGHKGNVTGPIWNKTGGKIGGAYEFDGIDDLINVSNSEKISLKTAITIEAWIKQINSAGMRTIVSKHNEYILRVQNESSGGGFSCYIYVDGFWSPATQVNKELTDEFWHHVACTWDNSTGDIKIYVDGKLNASQSGQKGSINPTNNPLSIGNWDDDLFNVTSFWKGTIDEVRIYDKALSPEQISAIYESENESINSKIIVAAELTGGDNWHCQITPNDGYEDGISENSTSRYVYEVPYITSINIYPSSPNSHHNLSCNITAQDSDNATVTVEYWWYKGTNQNPVIWGNATNIITGQSQLISALGSGNTSNSEVWNCTVRANDGSHYSSYNSTIVSLNDPPTQSTPYITPDPAHNALNLTCNYNNVNDVDGDSFVNITNWYKNYESIMSLYFPFEGGSNSTYTKDYSGNQNDGTVYGTNNWIQTGGKIGGGYYFDGSSNRIDVGDIGHLGTDYSVELWVKPATSGNPLISRYSTTDQPDQNNIGFQIDHNSFDARFIVRDDANTIGIAQIDNALSPGEWYHLVGVRDGNNLSIYVNGTGPGTDSKPFGTTYMNKLVIGDYYRDDWDSFYNYYYNGSIDEFRIYNHSLSEKQILELYQAGLANHTSNVIISDETTENESWKCEVTLNDGYQDGNTLNSSERYIDAVDFTSPQWSNSKTSPPSPSTYNPRVNYQFNVTWFDSNIDKVTIEHNLTGSDVPHNESFTGNNGWEYYFDISDIGIGTYVWRSFSNDTFGNENVTNQWIYTTTVKHSGGSTGLDKPPKKTHIWTEMLPDKVWTMRLDHPEIELTEVNLVVNKALKKVKITVERVDESVFRSEMREEIYRCFDIKKYNLDNEDIKEGKIRFSVNKKWIDENSIDENRVFLKRYKSNLWEKLVTRLIEEDSEYYYYEAENNGFSLFSIVGEKKGVKIESESTTTLPITTTTQYEIIHEKPKNKLNSLTVLLILILLTLITLLVFSYRKPKNTEDKIL
jgi:PGF-pre-PGF domain-containing protein